jgi:hypothetical protein
MQRLIPGGSTFDSDGEMKNPEAITRLSRCSGSVQGETYLNTAAERDVFADRGFEINGPLLAQAD